MKGMIGWVETTHGPSVGVLNVAQDDAAPLAPELVLLFEQLEMRPVEAVGRGWGAAASDAAHP